MKWIWNGFTVQKAKLTSDEPGQAGKDIILKSSSVVKYFAVPSALPKVADFYLHFVVLESSHFSPLVGAICCGKWKRAAVLRCAVKRNAMRGHSRITVFRTAASACCDGFFIVNQVGSP